jgi:hypothetical protein
MNFRRRARMAWGDSQERVATFFEARAYTDIGVRVLYVYPRCAVHCGRSRTSRQPVAFSNPEFMDTCKHDFEHAGPLPCSSPPVRPTEHGKLALSTAESYPNLPVVRVIKLE